MQLTTNMIKLGSIINYNNGEYRLMVIGNNPTGYNLLILSSQEFPNTEHYAYSISKQTMWDSLEDLVTHLNKMFSHETERFIIERSV